MEDKLVISKTQLRELVKDMMIREEFSSNNEYLNFRGYEKLSETEEKEVRRINKEDELVKFEL